MSSTETDPTPERSGDSPELLPKLQKVLAAAGVASRRVCEELIEAGRVTVDGQVVDRQGMRLDPTTAVIHVDGERLILDDSLRYLALHKPRGVMSTMSDDRGRPTIAQYVSDVDERVFHVGRLDFDSEGLLLLTNDGELAHRLTHPSFGVPKVYLAEVSGVVKPAIRRRLLAGVTLDDGPVKADRFHVVDQLGERAMVEIELHEGRKHIVRRMLAEVGHPVSRLIRTRFGPIALGQLGPGHVRELTRKQVGQLYKAVGL